MFFIAHLRLPKRSVRTEGFKNKAVYAAFHRSILAFAPARIVASGYAVPACAGCTAFKMPAKSGKKQALTGKDGE